MLRLDATSRQHLLYYDSSSLDLRQNPKKNTAVEALFLVFFTFPRPELLLVWETRHWHMSWHWRRWWFLPFSIVIFSSLSYQHMISSASKTLKEALSLFGNISWWSRLCLDSFITHFSALPWIPHVVRPGSIDTAGITLNIFSRRHTFDCFGNVGTAFAVLFATDIVIAVIIIYFFNGIIRGSGHTSGIH